MKRRIWTESEKRVVRSLYRSIPASAIAAKIGRTDRQVYCAARNLGLCDPNLFNAPDMQDFIRAKNAEGWSDSEIARARNVDRHAVTRSRKLMGLPFNRFSEHCIGKVRAKTQEQLSKAGLPSMAYLRIKSFQDRARAAGWPADLRPRAVQILNSLWDRGPMTRREIADVIGMPWNGSRKSLLSRDPEGTYLAHLKARGLVIVFKRAFKVVGKGKGHSCDVYSLPLWIERKVS